jgi:hypothetical protein
MTAAERKFGEITTFLIKNGADLLLSLHSFGTAADLSRRIGAPAEQTAYLEVRTHCSAPGCDGACVKKCAGCLKISFCTRECQLAHWSAHKAECRQSADKAACKKS